jgi:hypothetical protein
MVGDNEGYVKLGGGGRVNAQWCLCTRMLPLFRDKYNFHNFWCTQVNLHYKPTIDLDKRKDNKFHDHMMQHKHSMHVKSMQQLQFFLGNECDANLNKAKLWEGEDIINT